MSPGQSDGPRYAHRSELGRNQAELGGDETNERSGDDDAELNHRALHAIQAVCQGIEPGIDAFEALIDSFEAGFNAVEAILVGVEAGIEPLEPRVKACEASVHFGAKAANLTAEGSQVGVNPVETLIHAVVEVVEPLAWPSCFAHRLHDDATVTGVVCRMCV